MLPDLDSDEFDIKKLSKDELSKVPFEVVRWQCMIKFCTCSSRMQDYGLHPVYYWRCRWINIHYTFLICSKHWKRYKGKRQCDIPFKKTITGRLPHNIDYTKKPTVVY